MKYLVVVLLFISSVCSAREIWDGYFYIDGKKMDCDDWPRDKFIEKYTRKVSK